MRCTLLFNFDFPFHQSSRLALQGASQTLSRSDTAARQAKRKQQLLEAQLARISAVSGRPVTALGAPGLLLSSLEQPPRPATHSAFGYIKPQPAMDLQKETALLRVRHDVLLLGVVVLLGLDFTTLFSMTDNTVCFFPYGMDQKRA